MAASRATVKLSGGALFVAFVAAACGAGTQVAPADGAFGSDSEQTIAPGLDSPARAGAPTDDDGPAVVAAPPTLPPGATVTTSMPSTLPPVGGQVAVEASTTTDTTVDTPAALAEPSESEPDPEAVEDGGNTGPDGADGADDEESSATPDAQATAADLIGGEAVSLGYANKRRADVGAAPLQRSEELDAFAHEWAKHMAETGAFEHSTGPYAENIAFTSNSELSAADVAQVFHDLWIDSADHDRNMINADFGLAGIGLYRSTQGWYGIHVFAPDVDVE